MPKKPEPAKPRLPPPPADAAKVEAFVRGEGAQEPPHATPPAPAAHRAEVRRLVVTTFRVYADQLTALRHAAEDERATRGTGKADASELLRHILDEWVARQK